MVNLPNEIHTHGRRTILNKVTEFTKRVKGQVNNPVLAKDSWVTEKYYIIIID